MYLVDADATELRDWLIQSGEIGFLISDGEHRWRAVERIAELPDGRLLLWHIPSGPLPLSGKTGNEPQRWMSLKLQPHSILRRSMLRPMVDWAVAAPLPLSAGTADGGASSVAALLVSVAAELPDGCPLRIWEGYKLEPMVKLYLIANDGPRLEQRGGGRKREPQLHRASNRDWFDQDCGESSLGDVHAAPAKITPFVITNLNGQVSAVARKAAPVR